MSNVIKPKGPEMGRYVRLTWPQIVELICEKYGADPKENFYYLSGFRPTDFGDNSVITIEIPDIEKSKLGE